MEVSNPVAPSTTSSTPRTTTPTSEQLNAAHFARARATFLNAASTLASVFLFGLMAFVQFIEPQLNLLQSGGGKLSFVVVGLLFLGLMIVPLLLDRRRQEYAAHLVPVPVAARMLPRVLSFCGCLVLFGAIGHWLLDGSNTVLSSGIFYLGLTVANLMLGLASVFDGVAELDFAVSHQAAHRKT